jgi:hypothetical protein
VEQGDLLFAVWWYGVGLILAVATWSSMRERALAPFEDAMKVLLIAIAAGLVLYLLPSGIESIGSIAELKLRFLAALGLGWLAAMNLAAARGEAGCSGLALAAFVGVNAPLLSLVLSATMVCGGRPSCL